MYPSNPHCKGLCGKDQIIPPGDLVPYIDIIIFAVPQVCQHIKATGFLLFV